eukprot:TRINITY_DN2918_c0_g1_i2.p1 TRINITY_DN2918_c0_g1~~TRINITY_DN2918_c0_g1_i2.p1  ORF type:complete len:209 (-),score=41.82 TRINITY_DN2918_c0_g1_i2:32-658(-)
MAPEVLDPEEYKGYDRKADIWSLGITAIELAYGYPPYAKAQPMKVIMMVMRNAPPSLLNPENTRAKNDRTFSKTFQNFVSVCLSKDPRKRPTASKLLEHKFFSKAAEKEAEYIKTNLLHGLPSIGERFKKIYAINLKTDKSNESSEQVKHTESWDFEALEESLGKKDTTFKKQEPLKKRKTSDEKYTPSKKKKLDKKMKVSSEKTNSE